jgi:predicted AlkP superfamily phosphohydrolase/phosphomutase
MGLFDRLRGGEGPRVAFFGIDGVPYSLISDNEEVFENLNELQAAGSGGPIDSIVPPESSACWPALTTGVNPGETGVYGFQDREVGSYDTYVPMGRDVQATRLWSRVDDAGREATVMNVPVTFPPDRDIQRMVSGFLSPGVEKAAYPDELRETLEDLEYKIDVNAKLGHKEDKEAFIEDAHRTLDARFDAFKHYIQQDDWNLFFGVFMTTDRVNHFLFKHYTQDGEYKQEFLEFYEKVDQYLGELREMLDDETTMVVASDHGFTQLDHEVKCNVWLEENGWLDYEDDDHDSLGDISDDTTAYSLIPGRFYINLEGREPRGSVPEDEYEEVRAELKAELEELEGPDGRKVADRVVTREKAFRGDHDDIAPDLVVIPNHGFDLKSGFKGGDDVFTTGPRNGMHSFDNACLFIDDEDATVSDSDLYDIAPTVLDLLDIEVDRSDFDGASLI